MRPELLPCTFPSDRILRLGTMLQLKSVNGVVHEAFVITDDLRFDGSDRVEINRKCILDDIVMHLTIEHP